MKINKKTLLFSSLILLNQEIYSEEYKIKINSTNDTVDSIIVIETPKPTKVELSSGINCSNGSCTFNSVLGKENVTSFNWDFGDGNSSTEKNPSHSYTSSGNHNVCLTVTNEHNLTTKECKEVVIVDFTNSCSELSCNFSTSISGLKYNWEFGDGYSNTNLNESYTYSTSGSYNVCLEIESSDLIKDRKCKTISVIKEITQSHGSFYINGYNSHNSVRSVTKYICVDKAAVLTIRYRNNSEYNYDYLWFEGKPLRGSSGEKSFNINSGCKHYLFEYKTDGSIIQGQNRGYIDSLVTKYNQ